MYEQEGEANRQGNLDFKSFEATCGNILFACLGNIPHLQFMVTHCFDTGKDKIYLIFYSSEQPS